MNQLLGMFVIDSRIVAIQKIKRPSSLYFNDFSAAWTHVVNQNALIKKLTEENERLSAKVINDHKEVIEIDRGIKNIREQKIYGLKTAVESAVDMSGKKSYSDYASVEEGGSGC